MQACICRKLFLDYPLLIRGPQLGIRFWVFRPRDSVIEWMQPPRQTFFLLVTQSSQTKSTKTSNKKRRPITAHFKIWKVRDARLQNTGAPSSLQERGRDSCLRAVLCYKRLFTKACMGCKRFFLKERKNVMFLNKIDLSYCLVVFFVVCPRLRPF